MPSRAAVRAATDRSSGASRAYQLGSFSFTHREVTMNKSRSRLMAGLAALTLAGFAATSYGQNTNTPATTGGSVSTPADQSAPAAQPADPNASANTQAAPTTGTDATIGTSS